MRTIICFLLSLWPAALMAAAAEPTQKIMILCVSSNDYSYLLDGAGQRLELAAHYDRSLAYYRVDDDLFWQLSDDCKGQLNRQNKQLVTMQATYRVGMPRLPLSWGYGTYELVPQSFHESAVHDAERMRRTAPLADAQVAAAANRVFASLAGSYNFPVHPWDGDERRTLERHASRMPAEAAPQGQEPAASSNFYSEQVVKDLTRESLVIYNANDINARPSLVYHKQDWKISDLKNHIYVWPKHSANEYLFAEMPFDLLEEVLSKNEAVAQLPKHALRRAIALALESRTQTFEFPATYLLNVLLLNRGPGITWQVSKEGKQRHTIFVRGHTLELVGTLVYKIAFLDPNEGIKTLGFVFCQRGLTMNMVTREFSHERITLSRDMPRNARFALAGYDDNIDEDWVEIEAPE